MAALSADKRKPLTEMTDMIVAAVEVITDGVEQNGPMVVRFRGTRANVLNENGRIYPDAVIADAVQRASEQYVAKGRMIGESPHPKPIKAASGKMMFDTRLENSVIKVSRLFKDGPDVYLDAEVLDTAKGRDLKALLRQHAWPGISMRALGDSVRRDVNGVAADVATFLDIQSFDVVMNPATDGCGALAVLTDSQIEQLVAAEEVDESAGTGEQAVSDAPVHVCPHCGGALAVMDPDNDGDVDFVACAPCGCAFVLEASLVQETRQNHTLRQLSRNDWDGYGLAREWLETHGKESLTDSVKEAGEIVKLEDLINAMQNDPTVRAAMADSVRTTIQPALDAVEEGKRQEALATSRADAKAFVDSKLEALKATYDERTIGAIRDSVGDPANTEMAQALLDSALKVVGSINAKAFTDAAGFDPSNASQQGQPRVEVGQSAQPWRPVVDAICKEMDDYREQMSGNVVDLKLRAVNRKGIIDKVLPCMEEKVGSAAMADSAKAFTDGVMGGQVVSDSVSVTTTQLLNQPTILTAIIVQAFQDVESGQFLFTDTFRGSEWRQPIETFTSAAAWNPATGLQDLAVSEAAGIVASALNLTWQSFSPTWRRNAVSLTKDVIRQLQSGPVNYGAIARAIYHIAEDKRRKLDNAAYLEMIMASDEYAPLAVVNETPATAGAVTATGLPAGTNAAYLYKLVPATPGYVAPTISSGVAIGGNPVVRPRTVNQILPSGQVSQVTTNPVTVKVGSTPLVLGAWDGTTIQSFPNTTAQCAIDFEHGILYIMATGTSGVNPAASTPLLPTISYSAATNYDRWSYTMANGYTDIAAYYDTLLQRLTNTAATMGSSPRFKKPNLALFSLQAATYVENARIFYKWASPDGTRLIDTGNTFGQRAGMNLSRINAPWVAGDGRILLTQKGSTRYGIETPYEMEGPFPVYDSNQNIVDAKVWFGSENSVLCTPQVRDTNNAILNPVSRTIILEP